MKSISKIHQTSLFGLVNRSILNNQNIKVRTYFNFNDYLYQSKQAHLALDSFAIATLTQDLVLNNPRDANFDFGFGFGFNHHHADIFTQQVVSSMSPNTIWSWPGFGIKSIIDNSTNLKHNLDQKLLTNISYFNDKKFVDKKCNTVQELVCATVAPKCSRIDYIELNKSNKPILFSNINPTSNRFPDYACAVVLQNGRTFRYFADLKITDLRTFEATILGLHKKRDIYCNIYVIGDLSPNHVFSFGVKSELCRIYYTTCHLHHRSKDIDAIDLVTQSKVAFSNFLNKGDVKSYNAIPLNTVKFITIQDIKNIFP